MDITGIKAIKTTKPTNVITIPITPSCPRWARKCPRVLGCSSAKCAFKYVKYFLLPEIVNFILNHHFYFIPRLIISAVGTFKPADLKKNFCEVRILGDFAGRPIIASVRVLLNKSLNGANRPRPILNDLLALNDAFLKLGKRAPPPHGGLNVGRQGGLGTGEGDGLIEGEGDRLGDIDGLKDGDGDRLGDNDLLNEGDKDRLNEGDLLKDGDKDLLGDNERLKDGLNDNERLNDGDRLKNGLLETLTLLETEIDRDNDKLGEIKGDNDLLTEGDRLGKKDLNETDGNAETTAAVRFNEVKTGKNGVGEAAALNPAETANNGLPAGVGKYDSNDFNNASPVA